MLPERTEEEQRARTTEPEGADAGDHTPEEREPGEAGRDAAESTDTTDYKKLWLESGKDAVEERNRRAREEQESFVERPGPSPVPPGRTDIDPLDMDDDSYIQHLAASGDPTARFAVDNDPVARRAILVERNQNRLERNSEVWQANVVLNEQLKNIRDDADRAEALKRWKAHRSTGRYRDINDVRGEIERERLAKENADLKAALAKNARRGPADAVTTHERNVTTTEIKARVVDRSDWQRTQDQLEFTNPSQFRANQRERRQGLIKFKGE